MPFLIGVPAAVMAEVRMDELGEVVILDADANRVDSPFQVGLLAAQNVYYCLDPFVTPPAPLFQDLMGLPDDVVANFRRAQKHHGTVGHI